jgi:hypothetical protein
MKDEILKKVQQIQNMLTALITKHYKLRESHQPIREGYNDYIMSNKYMYVKDVQLFFKSQKEYEETYLNLIQSGGAIGGIDSKLRFIPLEILAHEVMGSKPLDTTSFTGYNARLEELENSVIKMEELYVRHEHEVKSQLEIFNLVTTPRN